MSDNIEITDTPDGGAIVEMDGETNRCKIVINGKDLSDSEPIKVEREAGKTPKVIVRLSPGAEVSISGYATFMMK